MVFNKSRRYNCRYHGNIILPNIILKHYEKPGTSTNRQISITVMITECCIPQSNHRDNFFSIYLGI